MARVKPKRHPVVVDMTAMCDVAWLLLTFFILTTTFKKPDVEQIKPPSSISEKLLPDASLMTINSTKDGKFYFQPVENGGERIKLLDNMGKKYNMTFTTPEKNAFVKVQAIGVPMSKLKSYLGLPAEKQKEYISPTGIPMDSVKRELVDWVEQSLLVNGEYKLAVKGDVTTEYPKIKYLFEGLRDIKFNNFWLITSQETAPTQ
jgi:biopolymer transport protein ExbD